MRLVGKSYIQSHKQIITQPSDISNNKVYSNNCIKNSGTQLSMYYIKYEIVSAFLGLQNTNLKLPKVRQQKNEGFTFEYLNGKVRIKNNF